jgi:hypothetical protein
MAALLPWCGVNRGSAERTVAESSLPMADALILMMLLRRANNDTLEVPGWRTPALPELAAEVRMSVWTLRRRLQHLEQHGWVKYVPGRGRTRTTAYTMLPQPGPCDCPHKRRAPMTDAERARRYRQKKGCSPRDVKGCSPRDEATVKGGNPRDAESVKGCNPRVEKGATSRASSQVSPALSPRAHQGGGVAKGALACIGGCGRAARRGCSTCWDHAYLEAGVGANADTNVPRDIPGDVPRDTCLGCDRPARRACRTCWDHAHLEPVP